MHLVLAEERAFLRAAAAAVFAVSVATLLAILIATLGCSSVAPGEDDAQAVSRVSSAVSEAAKAADPDSSTLVVTGAYERAESAQGPDLLVLNYDGAQPGFQGTFLQRDTTTFQGHWFGFQRGLEVVLTLDATQDDGREVHEQLHAVAGASGVELFDPSNKDKRLVHQRECLRTGCYSQVCADGLVITPCIYKPEFACYPTNGFCARDESGACGWSPTAELNACLEDKSGCGGRPIGATCQTPAGTCEALVCARSKWVCPAGDVEVGLTAENCTPH